MKNIRCIVTLVGTANFATTNAIRIIQTTQSCGTTAAQFSFGGLNNPSVQHHSMIVFFFFGGFSIFLEIYLSKLLLIEGWS